MNVEINSKIEEFWDKISKHGISRIGEIKIHKGGYFSIGKPFSGNNIKLYGKFNDYNFNLNRVMYLYEDIVKIEPNNKNYNLKLQLMCEIVIILLMTSLEVYLRETFTALISDLKKFSENEEDKKKIDEIYILIKKNNPIFQDKEIVKAAYSLIGINILEIVDHEIWKRIFSKGKLDSKSEFPGYMQLRHLFIHGGAYDSLHNYVLLDEKYISNAIIDVTKIVYNIQIAIPDYTRSFMIDSIELFKHGKVKFIEDKE